MDDIFFDKRAELTITYRDRPHWKQPGKVHFVTWRQADSLPKVHLDALSRDREAWIARYGMQDIITLPYEAQREHHRLFHQRVQRWLDAGSGSCALRDPDALNVVLETMLKFDNERYRLGTFAIAGNHVHVLVIPYPGMDLSSITHSWKSYTAKAINRIRNTTGPFWKTESFDHVVRSAEHLTKYERYILRHVQEGAHVVHRSLFT